MAGLGQALGARFPFYVALVPAATHSTTPCGMKPPASSGVCHKLPASSLTSLHLPSRRSALAHPSRHLNPKFSPCTSPPPCTACRQPPNPPTPPLPTPTPNPNPNPAKPPPAVGEHRLARPARGGEAAGQPGRSRLAAAPRLGAQRRRPGGGRRAGGQGARALRRGAVAAAGGGGAQLVWAGADASGVAGADGGGAQQGAGEW